MPLFEVSELKKQSYPLSNNFFSRLFKALFWISVFSLVSITNIMSSFSFTSDNIFSSVVLFALLILKLLTFWLLNVISGKLLID